MTAPLHLHTRKRLFLTLAWRRQPRRSPCPYGGTLPTPYPWTKPSRSLSHRRPQAKNSKAQTMGAHVIFARGTCYNSAVGCGVLRCANRSLLRAVSAVCVQRTSYFVTVIFPSLWVPNQLVADVLSAVCAVAPVRDGRFVAPRHMFFVKIIF